MAEEIGLHPLSLEPAAITYATPEFEIAALRTMHIEAAVGWRAADLLVLQKFVDPGEASLRELLSRTAEQAADHTGWLEIIVGDRKIKIREPLGEVEEFPALLSIEPDNVLPTVSRRYAGRQQIDLWCWDNRVYKVRGKAAFWAALQSRAGRPVTGQQPPPAHVLAAGNMLETLGI